MALHHTNERTAQTLLCSGAKFAGLIPVTKWFGRFLLDLLTWYCVKSRLTGTPTRCVAYILRLVSSQNSGGSNLQPTSCRVKPGEWQISYTNTTKSTSTSIGGGPPASLVSINHLYHYFCLPQFFGACRQPDMPGFRARLNNDYRLPVKQL